MTLKNEQDFQSLNFTEIQAKILQLKKELILLKIKKTTKQKIKPHIIKKIKHQISQMLRLEKLKTR